jgi:hypothetical protein
VAQNSYAALMSPVAEIVPDSPPPQVHGFPGNSRNSSERRFLAALANFSEIRVKTPELKRRRSW